MLVIYLSTFTIAVEWLYSLLISSTTLPSERSMTLEDLNRCRCRENRLVALVTSLTRSDFRWGLKSPLLHSHTPNIARLACWEREFIERRRNVCNVGVQRGILQEAGGCSRDVVVIINQQLKGGNSQHTLSHTVQEAWHLFLSYGTMQVCRDVMYFL